jgi:hypothetical protein
MGWRDDPIRVGYVCIGSLLYLIGLNVWSGDDPNHFKDGIFIFHECAQFFLPRLGQVHHLLSAMGGKRTFVASST